MFSPVGRAASALAIRRTVSPGKGMPALREEADKHRQVARLNKDMSQSTKRNEVHYSSDANLRSAAGCPVGHPADHTDSKALVREALKDLRDTCCPSRLYFRPSAPGYSSSSRH
jgi:hypothetical protein